DALTEHWKPGRVEASISRERGEIEVKTEGVEGLSLLFGSGEYPLAYAEKPSLKIDGKTFRLPRPSDRSLAGSLQRDGGKWSSGARKVDGAVKRHGLQGPIDDAFMDRFIFVRPTGKPMYEKTGAWVKAEMARAIREWRRHFRGEAIVKDDVDVTESDLASS